MCSSHNNHSCRARFRDSNGQDWIAKVTAEQARCLEQQARSGTPPRVSIDTHGAVASLVKDDLELPLERVLKRYEMKIDPPRFIPFISSEWEDLLEQLFEEGASNRYLLYGPEGTGKDTLVKILCQRIIDRHGADRVVLLTISAEGNDRFVGQLEVKVSEFGAAVRQAKRAQMMVVVYFAEIESIFAEGDYGGSWEHSYRAGLRNLIDGTEHFPADLIFGSCNSLTRLGAPLLSRFYLQHIRMSGELAEGILGAHWPKELNNGLSSQRVVQTMIRETIAEATLASRKKVALRAPDLTAFNGRFLARLGGDIDRRIKIRRRKDAYFSPDQTFVDAVVRAHLEAMLAPAVEAAGTRHITEFTVREFDPHDLPVAIESKLEWCQQSQYLAS